jgi:hypothetical protein
LAMLPHVEQRQLASVRKPGLQGWRIDMCGHACPPGAI